MVNVMLKANGSYNSIVASYFTSKWVQGFHLFRGLVYSSKERSVLDLFASKMYTAVAQARDGSFLLTLNDPSVIAIAVLVLNR